MITDICNLSFFSLSFCYQKVNPRVFVGVRSGDSIMNQKPSPLHRASEWIVDHYRLFFVVFAALLVFSAVASGWVKVENDVAAYLPADSETRQGLDIMEQEFQTYGSAKILLRDTDADAAAATAEQIRAVDGVDSCTYTMNDTGSALLSVSLSDLEGSDTCAQTVQALRDLLDGSGAYIYSAEGYSISDQINGEVRGLLVIVAIILVTVLTFTSSTYAEVPILLITFLAAALINKGTMLISAGLLIGARVSSGAVAGMGRFVGVGSLITVFLVLFVLPQLLLLGDTFVRRTALPAQRRLPLTAASRAARWVLLAAAVFVMAVSPWSVVRTQQKRADRVAADTQLCGSAHSLGELAASLGAQQETYDALKRSFATGVVTDNVGQSRLESGQAEYDAGSEKLAAAKAQYAAGQAQLEQGKADYAAGQEKLAAAKEEYAAGQAQLAKIQPVYDAVHPAYQRYLDRQAEYDAAVASGDLAKAALLWPGVTAQKQIYETQLIGTGYSIESLVQAYEAGQAKLSAGAAQIAAAEQQLQDAQAQLAAGQQALDAAAAEIAAGQSKLDTAAGTLASGRQTLAANRQQLAQDLAALAPYEDDTERLEQGIAVLMQDETLRARAGASASYGDICALAQDIYTADMNTARTEAAVWTGICIALFAAGALAFAGVCLGHRRGKAVAWCTALAAILSVGCLIAMLAAGHGALRTLCLCAALALLVLAFVAAGFTLRQRAQRAQ